MTIITRHTKESKFKQYSFHKYLLSINAYQVIGPVPYLTPIEKSLRDQTPPLKRGSRKGKDIPF